MIRRHALKLGKPFEEQVPFSLGVVSRGRVLHTAGITARDLNGEVVGEGDMRAQVRQCFSSPVAAMVVLGSSDAKGLGSCSPRGTVTAWVLFYAHLGLIVG